MTPSLNPSERLRTPRRWVADLMPPTHTLCATAAELPVADDTFEEMTLPSIGSSKSGQPALAPSTASARSVMCTYVPTRPASPYPACTSTHPGIPPYLTP